MSEAARNEQQRLSPPDFLGRLIDRAFERGNQLEPRRRSLFEPQAAAVAADAVDWPVEDPAGRRQEYAAPSHAEGAREREINRLTVPGDAPALRERPQTELDSRNEPRRHATPESARRADTHDEPNVVASLTASSPTRPHEGVTGRKELTPRPRRMPMDVAADVPSGTPHEAPHPVPALLSGVLLAQRWVSVPETTHQPEDVRVPESGDALPVPTESSEGVRSHAAAPTPRARRIVVKAATARHRAPREPLHPEAETYSPEPVVNVTIGRIEVRAVPAQPGPTRQRPQGPKPMSLDDYLKQRGGGR
ncbi:MAG: hypothetical protein EOP19_03460 [Hyphomicrobiales bacterium]|nr:MAG: hypothetical protein EOP19_03460 [Hyphomicrobiales bacterium]